MGTIKIYGKMVSGGVTSWYEITGAPTTLAGYGITDAAPSSLTTFVHDNSASWEAGGGGGVSLTTVSEVSAATLASANSYTDTAVAGKANTSHSHAIADVTGLQAELDGKQASGSYASASHSHAIADVTGLQTALNSFVPLSGGTITGSLSVLGDVTYIETSVAVTSAMYIDTSSTETALRVTQSGSGDAIRVEDSTNPDTTPFIVKSDGLVGVGTADPNEKLTVVGNVSATAYQGDAYKATSSSVNAQTGTSYTLLASDNGKIVTLSNASAITVTVPSGLGAGFSCMLVQIGAGQVTISGSGVTVNSYQGYTKIAGQHAGASLFAYSADVFNLNGSLAS